MSILAELMRLSTDTLGAHPIAFLAISIQPLTITIRMGRKHRVTAPHNPHNLDNLHRAEHVRFTCFNIWFLFPALFKIYARVKRVMRIARTRAYPAFLVFFLYSYLLSNRHMALTPHLAICFYKCSQ